MGLQLEFLTSTNHSLILNYQAQEITKGQGVICSMASSIGIW